MWASTASRAAPVILPPTVPCPGKTTARSSLALCKSDPVQVRSPGQSEPEADGDDVPSRLHRLVDIGVGERDARRRSIPEPVEVDHDPVLGYLHLAHGRTYYACIRLMGYYVLDLPGRECVAREELLDHLGQYLDGELEDLAAVLKEFIVVAGVPGSSQRRPSAVGTENVVDETRVPVAGVEYDRPGAVTEEHSRGTIPRVDDGAHGVGADEQDPARRAGVEHGRSDGGSIGEPGARRREVHRARAWGPDLLADQARHRGHGLGSGRGAADDKVDRPAVYPGVLERLLRGLHGERRGVLSFRDEVSRLYPRTRRDPLVRGVEHVLQVAVGDDPAPESPADADDPAGGAAVQADLPSATREICEERARCSSPVKPAPVCEIPRIAFSTPLAREFPWPITTEPLTPSRKDPP